MIKYIESETASAAHFNYCQKNHTPYIQVHEIDKEYSEIFFDITDWPSSKEIANHLYAIYKSYVQFFQINQSFVTCYLDAEADYFHTLAVKKEHVKTIVEALFDFIHLYKK